MYICSNWSIFNESTYSVSSLAMCGEYMGAWSPKRDHFNHHTAAACSGISYVDRSTVQSSVKCKLMFQVSVAGFKQ